jgi:putative SOS response-associated peptidase YedK
MCGRFAHTLPHEAMARLFDATLSNDLPEVPNYNVCPTNPVAAVISGDGTRRLTALRWGFIPAWYKKPNDGPLLINARAETIATKPAFRDACRHRRCLIPATGFYEWTKDEDGTRWPHYFHHRDGSPMVFAGIWQAWQDMVTCAIVSCAAGPSMSDIHHREPVTLAPEDWAKWLGEDGHGAASLMRASPQGRITRHAVDRAVNSNRATGQELIAPVGGD